MTNFSDVRIFFCTTPTKMSYSFDHLMGQAEAIFNQDPLSGHLFLFLNRRFAGLTQDETNMRLDDFGYYPVENPVHMHDLHATLLHTLGLDHERLTYRHVGHDFRLTDVYGYVVHGILA